MKKSVSVLFLVIVVFGMTGILAETCDLKVSMINQDPYPAIPGDYVKMVFQVNGVSNSECGQIRFELLEKYPLSFDPGMNAEKVINSGVYAKDFSSYFLASYKVRVDEDAVDGENPIEVKYKPSKNEAYETKQFDLNVEDSRADFEVFIKSYDQKTKEITFEILNIAESDVEALTVEVPKQDNIVIKGSKTNIVGDLDSNEFTTADFEAIPSKGDIIVKISYSDVNNFRRSLEKTVSFEPEYFENRASDKKQTPKSAYIIGIIVVIIIVWYIRKRIKKKRHQHHTHHKRH